jgi:hypothetical protein
MSHYHRDASEGLSASMMFVLVIAAAALIGIAVLAWSPWTDDEVTPGQGGSDEAVPEQRTTSVPGQAATSVPGQVATSVPTISGGNATPPVSTTPSLPR